MATMAASDSARDWPALAKTLGLRFAERAAALDESDTFAAENYAELKQHRVFSAAVPAEFGGGGASYRELAAFLRVLAHHCGSTALALSMHTHTVARTVWTWKHMDAPVVPLLRRVAAEQMVLISTGGNDWLDSLGTAERVPDGFRITARKPFASAMPAGTSRCTRCYGQSVRSDCAALLGACGGHGRPHRIELADIGHARDRIGRRAV